jgi:dipeptidyl aminopeptidase/acylaminoacyl peptidase
MAMKKTKKTPKPRPLAQDDVFRSQHVLDAALSPDGTTAVYQLTEYLPGDVQPQVNSLWRVDVETGESRRLTPRDGNASSPVFTPDGSAVIFVSSRGAEGAPMQIHRLPLDGGEAEPITTLPQGVTMFSLSPDGKHIAFVAFEAPPQPRGPNDHVRIDRYSYRFDPVPGYLQDLPQAVYMMPSKGGKPRAVTPHDGIVMAMAWSPSSSELAYAVIAKKDHTSFAAFGDLCVVDTKGKNETILENQMVMMLFWTADGKKIGYPTPPKSDLASQTQLWLVDRATGKRQSRSRTLDLPVGGLIQVNNPGAMAPSRPQLTADGKAALVPVSKGGETGIWRIALSGRESCEPVVAGKRTCKPLDRNGSKVLFTAQDLNTPSELWIADLETGKERALTTHNAEWQAEIRWPAVEHVTVTSAPGVEIEGWVLKPRHVRAPHKTVLYIHGGPHAGFGYSFNEDFQELVGAGYAVAFANPRGSTGYGDAFSKSIIGCWGKPEHKDFDALLDELAARGIADPDRLGVMGWSNGGFLTNCLITTTDRFKAASSGAGVIDQVLQWGIEDTPGHVINFMSGRYPWAGAEEYRSGSPLYNLHKVKTPTLIHVGENDPRVPAAHSRTLYRGLRFYVDVPTELVVYPGAAHGLSTWKHRLAKMEWDLAWFDRYLLGKEKEETAD